MGSPIRTELSSLVLVVLSLSLFYLECLGVKEEVKGYPPSVNCAKQECAPYQVVQSQKEFEIRIYKNSTWISSGFITTISYTVAYSAGYIDVLKYFRGDNKQGLFWDETFYVLTDIIPKTSYDSIYKVYLYVPKDYQNATLPPPFEGSDVKPVKLPRRKFAAVTRFDGYLTDTTIAAELAALKKSLTGTPWQSAAASRDLSVVDYNPFNQYKDRVVEVILWFDKK